jgi:tetratricopeptide (TPR) repeat protein
MSVKRSTISEPFSRKEHLSQLAESYFSTADNDESIANYQETIKLDSRYGAAYNNMGFAYSWNGDHRSAIRALEQYLAIPPVPNAYDSLGSAFMYAGLYKDALRMKQRAYQADSNLYYVKCGLGMDRRDKLPHPRRGFWIPPPPTAVRALAQLLIK